MVNGPEVWTQPGWTMNWWWIDSWMAVLCCITCLLTSNSQQYASYIGKILENFPHSSFPEKLQPYTPHKVCTLLHTALEILVVGVWGLRVGVRGRKLYSSVKVTWHHQILYVNTQLS